MTVPLAGQAAEGGCLGGWWTEEHGPCGVGREQTAIHRGPQRHRPVRRISGQGPEMLENRETNVGEEGRARARGRSRRSQMRSVGYQLRL